MDLLSQLDISNPDHVSVITREGRVTISIRKDGSDVTVGFPVNKGVFDTTPRPPLQQSVPVLKAVRSTPRTEVAKRKGLAARFNAKLTAETASQIKEMLNDKGIMSQFSSKHQAYIQIGKAYGVSNHTIRSIAKGIAWKEV